MEVSVPNPAAQIALPYELRLGVTGHRKLSDPEAVGEAVRALLGHIDATLNHQDRTPLEWVAISPLALGSDRIVARSILARSQSKLECPSPFRLDEYRNDFSTPEDRSEFEELLARSSTTTELNKDENFPANDDERSLGYLNVGRSVVDSCELLIAIWDGKPAGGRGGTAEIISYALAHDRAVVWIHSERPAEPPVMLLRKPGLPVKSSGSSTPSFTTKPLPEKEKELSLGYHQLAGLNRDTNLDTALYEKALAKAERELRAAGEKAGLDPSQLDPIVEDVLPLQVRAGELAELYQRRYVWASMLISYISAVAVWIVAFQFLFFPDRHGLIVFEIIALLIALGVIILTRKEAWHEKWLHDRYFCEQLRTATFTLALGEDPCPPMVKASETISFYGGPEGWLAASIKRIARGTRQRMAQPIVLEPVRKFIHAGWLADQRDWHHRNSIKKNRRAEGSSWTVFVLFCLTLVMAGLHFITHDHVFTFLAIALPALGGTVRAIGKQLEYERIASRSEQMSRVLAHLCDRTDQARNLEDFRIVVREAAHIIGLENYEWLVLLSFDAPELAA